MKCPLLIIATLSGQGRYDWAKSDCLKEECAWWVNNSQQCVMNKLGVELWVIGEVLEEIRDKMLHEKERLV